MQNGRSVWSVSLTFSALAEKLLGPIDIFAARLYFSCRKPNRGNLILNNLNEQHNSELSSKETYNIVADTAVGVNVRWQDNLIQAITIFVFALIGGLIGFTAVTRVSSMDRIGGVLVGIIIGLVAGLLFSGTGIMLYRLFRHISGKHD